MELIFYLLILLTSLFFSVKKEVVRSTKSFGLIYFSICFLLSIVVRFSEFDTDIENYANAMSSSSFSFYYLREPVVWLGQRYLYQLIGSEVAVFIIFDMILFLFLYVALKNYKVPQYAYFSILCFFPFILGMQNVYRQWAAVTFVLLSFSIFYKSYKSRYFSYLLAGLSHNVAGLFIAPFFLLSKRISEKLAGLIFLAATPVIVALAADTKSEASTGQNLVVAYIFLILLIAGVMTLSSKLKIRLYERKSYIVLACSMFSVAITALMLTSTGAERTAMFALVLLYPHLVNFFEWRFKQKLLLRASLTLLGFFPLLMFGTRHFIL